MAAAADPDKTEKASPQKLRKAREEGQVARSRDWATALGLCISLQLIVLQTPSWLEEFRALFARSYPSLAGDGALENAWSAVFAAAMLLLLKMLLPLFAIPLVACAGSLFPGGWTFTPKLLAPRFERLNPAAYFQRIFKPKHLADTGTALIKAVVLIIVLWCVVRSGVTAYLQLQSEALPDALRDGSRLMLNGVMALCAVFVLLAVIDLPVQMLLFARSQRMSKREVKDEQQTNEGRPEVRQRIRQLQMQMSRRAIRKSVPAADVVIVNPEHYAVALKYDEKRAQAPFVIAKGMDEMALYIRQIALDSEVEVLSIPLLARAIYNTSQVNQQIPAALYEAVARVLTFVFQIQAFRSGRRPSQPHLGWSDLIVPQHLRTPSS